MASNPISFNDNIAASPNEAPYFNRELSWLAFNERVLAEAGNPGYPLLERLRFLAISGSNLDEFVMIRVAGLAGQVQRGIERLSIDGSTPAQQLSAVRERVQRLSLTQEKIWSELHDQLSDAGIHVADEHRIQPEAIGWLEEYFLEEILPVITPQALDPAHPFPFVNNGGLGLLFTLKREDEL